MANTQIEVKESNINATPEEDSEILKTKLKTFKDETAGNKALRDSLDWEEDKYWSVRNRLIDQGILTTGRGKGGSVKFTRQESNIDVIENNNITPIRTKETDLYPQVKQTIHERWAKDAAYDQYIVAITGLLGGKTTGGKWTRPDITFLGIKAYPFLPNRIFDVITFEVKPSDQINVEGVFEALSHNHFSSKSYVIYHTDNDSNNSNTSETDYEKNYPRIFSLARKHGIGIIFADKIDDYDTWEEWVKPLRSDPDPEELNNFVGNAFNQADKDTIIKWHK